MNETKKCLQCTKEYEAKKPTSKFCSTSCRVMYNRKKEKIKVVLEETSSKAILNKIMGFIEKMESGATPALRGLNDGKPYDFPNETPLISSNPVKLVLKRNYEQYCQLKLECGSEEEWAELRAEIELADHIPTRYRKMLLNQN